MKNVIIITLLTIGGLRIAARADEATAGPTNAVSATQAVAVRPVSGPNLLEDKFRQALIEEETGQHLNTAIRAYQDVIAGLDEQREMAVTAIFHLGECYRRQGNTNDAMAQYERILRDFSEQKPVVDLARRRAGELSPGQRGDETILVPGSATQTSFAPEQVRMVREEIGLVETQLVDVEGRFKSGRATTFELHKTQQDLLRLKRMLPENAAPANQKSLIEQQMMLVETRLREMRTMISVGRAAPTDNVPFEREMLGLKRELMTVSQTSPSVAEANDTDAATPEAAGEIQRLKAMVKDSPDLINAKDGAGKTPLHRAASAGHLAAAKYLIANAADLHAKDGLGRTALHAACECGHKSVVEFLLIQGADLNAKDVDGATPLLLAVDKGFKSLVQVLLDHQADVNAPGFVYLSPHNDNKIIRFHTPLEYSFFRGRLDIARLLLAYKADPNATNSWGGTPIFSVFPPFSPDIKADEAIELLVLSNANVNLNIDRNEFGWSGTPLHFAVRAGQKGAAEYLLTHGARPDLTDANGETPLHLAIQKNQIPMVELLLNHKADANIASREGKTPLMLAREVLNAEDASESPSTKGPSGLEALLRKYGATDTSKKAE